MQKDATSWIRGYPLGDDEVALVRTNNKALYSKEEFWTGAASRSLDSIASSNHTCAEWSSDSGFAVTGAKQNGLVASQNKKCSNAFAVLCVPGSADTSKAAEISGLVISSIDKSGQSLLGLFLILVLLFFVFFLGLFKWEDGNGFFSTV